MSHAVVNPHRCTTRAARTSGLSRVELALLALLALALLVAAATATGNPGRDLAASSVRVHAGDTPWSIAQSHPVDGLTTAQTADLIIEMNGVDGSCLVAGESIRIPSGSPETSVAMR